ncbi:heparan-alpha-glucosaminide N-acetyltransferase domain-containing protein [Agromyces subbeticus]|uniref:heparan-alpha-glucosaminide N-acetyltransferase domain-containing protein n=1 Tax=Agromyces subbeticus TaxID=293890 RepID=UPI0003B561C2|nr:heparan-alpha-glucosaminide N-acetyltransferase domain-containing protein [Agromyces subbeticus]
MALTTTSARVIGVDTARGLALIGMFVAHVAPVVADPTGAALLAIADERPRLLFALTAGVGLGFMSGGIHPIDEAGPARGVLRRQIAIRAIALIVLGVTIALTLHPLVFIILDVYGVAFLLMLPLLFLPPRVALGVGVGLLAVMPAIAEIATRTAFVAEVRATPFGIIADWFVGGAYPVIIWVPVMLIGLALARLDLGSPRTVGLTGLFGAASAALLLPLAAILPSPQSLPDATWSVPLRAALETVANVGVGAAVLAVLLWLTGLASTGVRRAATAVASPVTAMGSMPLSVYTVHLVVIALAIRTDPATGMPTDDSWGLLVGLIVGSMLFAWLWRRFVGRGPLEWALRVLSGRSRRSSGASTGDVV